MPWGGRSVDEAQELGDLPWPGGLYAPSPASTGCPTSPCGTSSPATRRYCWAGVRCEPIHLAAGLFVTVLEGPVKVREHLKTDDVGAL